MTTSRTKYLLREEDMPDDIRSLKMEIDGHSRHLVMPCDGDSGIIGPDGNYLAGPVLNEEVILTASGNTGTDLGERFVVFRDGVDKEGEQLAPVRSSVGLALTKSLLAVNACSLSVDPTATTGTLFSLAIPAEAIVRG